MVCSVGVGTVADYYINEQAEYYTGGKEPTGKWYAPREFLGINDREIVASEMFRNLHDGLAPDGRALTNKSSSPLAKRVGGYDLTFSAPKSVSVIWAVGDEEIRACIEKAQEEATRAALDILQRHAGFARRGKGGATLEPVNFTGATFQHGEARPTVRPDGTIAADPQLHTHAVVFNLAKRGDGTWGALDGRHFFKWKMAAGAIYRAELASRLRSDLGLSITVDETGLFEVESVPKNVREHFSSRRGEIENDLAAHGLTTKDAQKLAAVIAKVGRRAKSELVECAESRHHRWQLEARDLGFECAKAAPMIRQEMEPRATPSLDEKLAQIAYGLTEHESTFRLEDLYHASAQAALEVGLGMIAVDQGIQSLLTNGTILEIGRDDLGLPVYSTEEMIAIESEVVRLANAGIKKHRHRLEETSVGHKLAQQSLTDEQLAGALFVTTGADIAVLEGSAGAGKTHTLKSVADVYRDQGYRVIGTATAWRMALQLGQELNIRSQATDAWLAQAEAGKPFLDDKTILIVDEAGQLSSRQMLRLLLAADDAQAKVILTGDQRQLQAIGAGPGLRMVAEQAGVARIDTIVRQKDAWARQAVTDLSLGRTNEAVAALEEHGAIHWCEDARDTVAQAVQGWKDAKAANSNGTYSIIAKTNAQVRALNGELRDYLRGEGILRGPDHVVKIVGNNGKKHDLAVAIGDQILFKKRIPEPNVINGTVGVVEGIEGQGADTVLRFRVEGRRIEVSATAHGDEQGRLPIAHAYATTIYASQGATVDRAYVIADHRLKRNEIYVAASRAKEASRIYVDESSVANSLKEQAMLSDPKRREVERAALRDYLVSAWSQAQSKSSTRDYVFPHTTAADPSRAHEAGVRKSTAWPRFMPKFELGR